MVRHNLCWVILMYQMIFAFQVGAIWEDDDDDMVLLPPVSKKMALAKTRAIDAVRANAAAAAGLARHVADVSPTCRRHRQMSPNLGRHCVSLRHRRGPDIPNFPQLQPTSTSQSKHTSTIATIEFLCLNSNNNQEITDMSGISRHVVKCRVV